MYRRPPSPTGFSRAAASGHGEKPAAPREAHPTGNRPLEGSVCFLLLPNEKRTFYLSVQNHSLPVHQRWQAKLAKFFVTDLREVTSLVASKDQAENLLSKPAIQQS